MIERLEQFLRVLRRIAVPLRLLACVLMLACGFAMLREESPAWQWKGLMCVVTAMVVAPLTLKGKL